MTKIVSAWLLFILSATIVKADEPPLYALLPLNLDNDEEGLLADALSVEPEVLKKGYRQYDLVVAHLAAYTQTGNVQPKDLRIRLILPIGEKEGPYPILVYLHGGGFMGGTPKINVHDERSARTESFQMALDNGIAIASIGYRRARAGGWPAPVSDPLCGMRFLHQNGEHWNLETDRLILVGHSAGARAVALAGMVPQDEFHTQGLPWDGEVRIAGTYLWAGGASTKPDLEQFGEFGKPRWYSVPRLHHGEHPAWSESSRQSIRIRHNFPHYDNTMPPIVMVRGSSDYGGDHSDAEQTVEMYEDLGIESTLSIVEGGHSATGPAEDLLAFIWRHLREQPFDPPARDVETTVEVLLAHDEPLAALEVLTAEYTTAGGRDIGPGSWLYAMHDLTMMWLPDHTDWSEDHQALAKRARETAAQQEAESARHYFDREDWFWAGEAVRNVRKLLGAAPEYKELLVEIETREAKENEFFLALEEANTLWHEGDEEASREILRGLEVTSRLVEVKQRLEDGFSVEKPSWADRYGYDLYGPWVAIDLSEDIAVRLRWVEPGQWDLPDYLHYQLRGRVDDETVTRVEVPEGFWIAETAITNAQWRALRSDEPIDLPEDRMNLPRVRKDYLQIIDWVESFSATREDLLVRLPTEMEWIHAATGGGRRDIRGGTDLHSLHALKVDPDDPGTQAAYSVVPDLTGLYGMVGGVLEWTASGDRREARFTDERGNFRIFRYPMSRGGAWSSLPHVLGVGTREWHRHGNRQPDLGFRLVIGGGAVGENWLNDVIRR
ncbi:MAG: SUMF1/EgtB/PvdO family nonheme iron enzyme [Opitutales bacterium]|nr:SUMF1/EgtB/PvdO family nonheme iron enzyme [Opitutales bacterium]